MTACIEWAGWRDRDGYGRSHRWQGTHRLAWIEANGPIPDGMVVCHRCDNPPCVNVAHLFLGTVADNNRDRALKGRSAHNKVPRPGEANGRALLTEQQVREIVATYQREGRRLRAVPRVGLTRRQLADRYGVSVPTIDAILSGRNWRHIKAA